MYARMRWAAGCLGGILALVALAALAGSMACGEGEEVPKFTDARVVMNEGVDLRRAPAEFAGVVEVMALGTPVTSVPDATDVSHDDTYLEVQLEDGRSGFVERGSLGIPEEWQRVVDLRVSVEGATAQSSGTLKSRANLRLAPGRDSRLLDSIAGKTPFSMYRRVAVMAEEDKEIWYLIDVGEGRIGYMYTRKLDFEVPRDLPSHARYRRTVAWQSLGGDEDHATWLVASASDGDLGCDYDQAEIYAWDPGTGAYGTMFTKKGLKGVLPLESEERDGVWHFVLRELLAEGGVTATRWADKRPAKVVETWQEEATTSIH